MAENSPHFNAPGSVFSQLNSNGSPNAVNQNGIGPTERASDIDTTSKTNNKIKEGEAMTDSKNSEYRSTREEEMVDPNKDANSTINNEIKNPKKQEPEQTKDTKIDVNTKSKPPETKKVEKSRSSSDTEQGWLERKAMKQINGWMSDGAGEVNTNEGVTPKDPDTSTEKSRKTGVGKVPALDRSREETSIPNSNNRPKPTPPNVNNTPKLKMPKVALPKMKLR